MKHRDILSPQEQRDWINRLRTAPRLTSLNETFEAIGAGTLARPISAVSSASELLGSDLRIKAFADELEALSGAFDTHYTASIPYSREEESRLGVALLSYCIKLAEAEGRQASVYITSGGDGPVPRVLAKLAAGKVATLTCSPNPSNRKEFYDRGAPADAHFFLGPYFDVTPKELSKRGMSKFAQGFDVIQEDTTFQMYDKERYAQIALVRRNLRPDGIFMLFEKLLHPDLHSYSQRERQKDEEFKSRFFSQEQIREKNSVVLRSMENMQVTLDELAYALSRHFRAAVITFNSGNFYNIAASNNTDKLAELISCMTPPLLPTEYSHHQLPEVLFGPRDFSCAFRELG